MREGKYVNIMYHSCYIATSCNPVLLRSARTCIRNTVQHARQQHCPSAINLIVHPTCTRLHRSLSMQQGSTEQQASGAGHQRQSEA
jgi:hypothetical protein